MAILLLLVVVATSPATCRAITGSTRAPPLRLGLVTVPGPDGASFSQQDVATMASGGATMFRMSMNWKYVQPTPLPAFVWTVYDPIVADFARQHIRIFPFLVGSTYWGGHGGQQVPPLGSAAEVEGWKRFVAAAVTRYGPQGAFWRENPQLPYEPIVDWEVWNEPNLPPIWMQPTTYATLLEITAETIRTASPQAKVVLGGLARGTGGTRTAAWAYLAHLYRRGAASSFDVLNMHPYSRKVKGAEVAMTKVRRVADKVGDSRTPLWVSEVGWSTQTDPGVKLDVGLRGQATRLRKLLSWTERNRRSLRLRRLLYFDWRDPSPPFAAVDPCVVCRGAGLLYANREPKPSWWVYSRYALLAAPRSQG